MATYYARKSGNINATDVWATTPTGTASDVFSSFTNGDVLVANSFTITLNVNTTVAEIRNDTTGGAAVSGSFSLSNGVVLTSNVFAGGGGPCVTLSGTASASIVGNITGGSANGADGVNNTSSGQLTIIGSIASGSAGGATGVRLNNAGAFFLTGNLTATVTSAIYSQGSGSINIVGNISSLGAGISLWMIASSVATVTGNITGGSGPGIRTESTARLIIIGTCTGGTAAAGLIQTSSQSHTITRAKGGALASSSVGVAASSAAGSITIEEIEYGDAGASPTSGPIRFNNVTSNVALVYRPNTTKKTLVDANATNLLPAASNVRSGTTYNAGQTTGTCAIPPASSVLFGVPVDNTTGTALLSSSTIQDACLAALTAFSNGRLLNVSTVASFGQQLSDSLSPP